MDRDEIAQLSEAIEKSVAMRQSLQEKLARGEFLDLVLEWEQIERLDHQITRMIRKRRPD